jgi:hypothetical protein
LQLLRSPSEEAKLYKFPIYSPETANYQIAQSNRIEHSQDHFPHSTTPQPFEIRAAKATNLLANVKHFTLKPHK